MKTKALSEPKQRKAFRDKYLAAVLAVAALLISSVVSAQTTDSLKYSQINGYGFKYKRHVSDSVQLIPLSTSPHVPYRMGAIRYRASDSTLQLWTGYQWNSILTGVGNGIDTAFAYDDSTLAIETPNRNYFIKIKGKPSATQLNDSTFIVGDDTITIHGTGGTSITLNNIGTGYALLATPGGNFKRINPGYGVDIDSTTTANTITVKADTSSTNHLITQSDLNDTAAVLRAAIGTGGGGSPGGNNFDIQFKNSSSTFGGSSRFTWDTTNKRVSIFGTSTTDLNNLNDHSLKIIGNHIYLGDTTSDEPTFIEFGDPYGASQSTPLRYSIGPMGTEEFNIGVNFHYRGQAHLKYDNTKYAQWLAFNPHYFLMQSQGIGYDWNDNAGSKVTWRFDNIETTNKVVGSILSVNGINIIDYTTSSYQNNDGRMAQFRVSAATLGIGGVQEIKIPDSTQVFLGAITDVGPLWGMQKTGGHTEFMMRNDDNSTNSNVIKMFKRRGSSYGITQNDRIGYLDWNTLNEFGVKANANTILSGAFRLGDFYWNTTDTSATTAERMRLNGEGNLLIGTTTDNGAKLQVNGDATVADEAYDATAWNGSLEVPTKNAIRDKIESLSTGNGIYGGSGSLPSDVTVTGGNNSITFDDIFAFRINSDYNVIAKANGTGNYTEAVVGAGNIYEIGYTPTAGTFGKGAGVFIDTNNNVGLGTAPPTTMPLYSTGSSTFIQGLQSNHGNYYKVSNQTADFTASLQAYFYTIDATSGNVTVTLPAASTAFGNTMGITYKFQRTDNSGNTVTIQRAGSDVVNGATSVTISGQYSETELHCTSTSSWAANEVPKLSQGTWTPTLSNITNTSSSSVAGAGSYMRVGNTVTFSVELSITPTSGASQTQVDLTLPIASAFANSYELSGTCSGLRGRVVGQTANDRASVIFVSDTGSAETITVHVTYRII